jgi:hypothetical protein
MDGADIVIIGAGAGAKLIWGSVPGRSVAVVERELVGGSCPFYACVPSEVVGHVPAGVAQVLGQAQPTGLPGLGRGGGGGGAHAVLSEEPCMAGQRYRIGGVSVLQGRGGHVADHSGADDGEAGNRV